MQAAQVATLVETPTATQDPRATLGPREKVTQAHTDTQAPTDMEAHMEQDIPTLGPRDRATTQVRESTSLLIHGHLVLKVAM